MKTKCYEEKNQYCKNSKCSLENMPISVLYPKKFLGALN
jgi:hypothetical protein